MQDLAKKLENLTIQSYFIFKKVMSRKRICIHRERICQDDFFNFSKLNKPAEKKSS